MRELVSFLAAAMVLGGCAAEGHDKTVPLIETEIGLLVPAHSAEAAALGIQGWEVRGGEPGLQISAIASGNRHAGSILLASRVHEGAPDGLLLLKVALGRRGHLAYLPDGTIVENTVGEVPGALAWLSAVESDLLNTNPDMLVPYAAESDCIDEGFDVGWSCLGAAVSVFGCVNPAGCVVTGAGFYDCGTKTQTFNECRGVDGETAAPGSAGDPAAETATAGDFEPASSASESDEPEAAESESADEPGAGGDSGSADDYGDGADDGADSSGAAGSADDYGDEADDGAGSSGAAGSADDYGDGVGGGETGGSADDYGYGETGDGDTNGDGWNDAYGESGPSEEYGEADRSFDSGSADDYGDGVDGSGSDSAGSSGGGGSSDDYGDGVDGSGSDSAGGSDSSGGAGSADDYGYGEDGSGSDDSSGAGSADDGYGGE